jgi:periodic tryptophan protein 1
MIAAVCWVPKGAAKNLPIVAEPPTEEEIRELLQQHESAHEGSEGEGEEEEEEGHLDGEAMEDAEAGGETPSVLATAIAAATALGATVRRHKSYEETLVDGLAELDMDRYDDEDEEGVEIFGNGGLGAAYYPSNEDDPYLVDKEDDDEEEIEDMTIKDSDLIVLTARNEDDVSHLEVWVYETEESVSEDPEDGNMYVHHDILLPAFPLCLSWLDCNPKGEGQGNYVAVGTMQPEIEIWDLDVVDSVEPVSVLGGALAGGETSKKKKKKSKKKAAKEVKYKEGSHTDAVLGLSWNSEFRNVIASGSADKSVKIWDIVKGTCEHTMNVHTDKVQAVAWNVKEPTVLLSGSFDRTVALTDMRAPQSPAIRWSVSADVESLAWDPHSPHTFLVSLEDGTVGGYDVRSGTVDPLQGKALFTIHAHEKAVCSLAYNTAAPNLLATASTDKMVKLWDLTGNQPSCIASTNPKVGAVFAASFCKDAPFLLAVGGSKGNLHVWDTLSSGEVARRFGKFSPRPRRVPNNGEA